MVCSAIGSVSNDTLFPNDLTRKKLCARIKDYNWTPSFSSSGQPVFGASLCVWFRTVVPSQLRYNILWGVALSRLRLKDLQSRLTRPMKSASRWKPRLLQGITRCLVSFFQLLRLHLGTIHATKKKTIGTQDCLSYVTPTKLSLSGKRERVENGRSWTR
jgi:hypothetical protein